MARVAAFFRLALTLALAATGVLILGLSTPACSRDTYDTLRTTRTVALADLPAEAQHTLLLIQRGGPFPYPHKDGSIFGNFEKRLPYQARGYYREYTVPTPGSRDRGARRIIAGRGLHGDVATSGEYYYTPDHYRSFLRIRQP